MSQKITLISFDHWNYDKHIVDALTKKGITATHIKIGNFKHKNWIEKIKNTLSKIFLNKNPKLKKRQDYILEKLNSLGHQDQILIINPELIDVEYHQEIKKYTKKYIAYLYDSVARCPINHLLDGLFDIIYSFDKNDILEYGFKKTTNYNYLGSNFLGNKKPNKNDVLYLASFDNRLQIVQDLKQKFDELKINYKFILIGKKTILYKLKNIFSQKIKKIEFRKKRISQKELISIYAETKIMLDLVRENQSGLSFRVFEAMALEKKLITNNQSIKDYDFYNSNNILVIDEKLTNIEKNFFETDYFPVDKQVFESYTVDKWVKKVFEI